MKLPILQIKAFRTKEKKYEAIVVALAFIGVTMDFVALCILSINNSALRKTIHKKSSTNTASAAIEHLFGIQWYHDFYYVAVFTAFCVLTVSPIFSEHRMIYDFNGFLEHSIRLSD